MRRCVPATFTPLLSPTFQAVLGGQAIVMAAVPLTAALSELALPKSRSVAATLTVQALE
ncbi:hypothetical protein D3C72_2394090 [compost metagenome]